MAVRREHPYQQFNFQVSLGDDIDGAFAEVVGLGMSIEVIEYRAGNSRVNEPIKIPGLTTVSNVTFRRGIVGALGLWEWIDATRTGDPELARDVTVDLLDQHHEPAMTWRLGSARPVAYSAGPLHASTNEVAIESLELCVERIDVV